MHSPPWEGPSEAVRATTQSEAVFLTRRYRQISPDVGLP
jgi:hypothetical protein